MTAADTIRRISSGTTFEKMAAYCRAVVDDRYVHVSGTVGVDAATGAIPDDVVEQAENIFATFARLLEAEGCSLADVVRSRVYLAAAEHLPAVVGVLGEKFRDFPPTNTTLICGIPAPGAKVEIEITARLRG